MCFDFKPVDGPFSAVRTINLSLEVNFLFQSLLVIPVFRLFNYLTISALFHFANLKLVFLIFHIYVYYIKKNLFPDIIVHLKNCVMTFQ